MTKHKHRVELERPEKSDRLFSAGERIIVVDGFRWGRTWVHHHGMHGTSVTFQQEGGGTIEPLKGEHKHYNSGGVSVRSIKKRRAFYNKTEWRPTDELVLEMAQKLVADGRLVHPDVLRQREARARETLRKAAEKDEAERVAEFRNRAREAIGQPDAEDGSIPLETVVAAMEWARGR